MSSFFATETKSAENQSAETSINNMALLDPSILLNKSNNSKKVIVVDGSLLAPDIRSIDNDEVPSLTFGQVSVYVVRKGDTLAEIAKMFDVSVNTIVWNNDIGSKGIVSGQELVILPISGIKHVVRKGDTVESIAKEHKGDVSEIFGYNRISSEDVLAVGMEIIVPDGEVIRINSQNQVLPKLAALLSRIRLPDDYLMKPLSKYVRTQGIHGYNGVDMGAPIGTPVYATHEGSVVISKDSGWNAGYGNYVVIEHSNGVQTLYAHMSSVLVKQGVDVSKGDVIGLVGNTGKSTGPHLHFEVRGAYNPF